jgi:hypothetical protein
MFFFGGLGPDQWIWMDYFLGDNLGQAVYHKYFCCRNCGVFGWVNYSLVPFLAAGLLPFTLLL